MPNTDRFSLLERWANGAEAFRDAMETKYGPAPTPPQLPPYTTYDAMLEAIVDNTVGAKRLLNKKSPTYHSDSAGYTKVVPAGDVHYASLEQIGGKTLVWNQLQANTLSRTSGGVVFTFDSTDGSLTLSEETPGATRTSTAYWLPSESQYKYELIGGHKYYAKTGNTHTGVQWFLQGYAVNTILTYPTTVMGSMYCSVSPSADLSTPVKFYPQVFDLTLMYGSGNEPSTVAEFQQTFPAPYYAYNPGSLLSAGVTEVVSKYKPVVWNQLCGSTTFPTTHGENGGTTTWSGDVVTYSGTVTSTSWLYVARTSGNNIPADNHKYLAMTDNKPNGLRFGIINAGGSFAYLDDSANYYLFTNASGIRAINYRVFADTTVNFTAHLMLFDLTLMYGAGNEPTTVEEFQAMFPSAYYPYNAGTEIPLSVAINDGVDVALQTSVVLQDFPIPAEIQALEGYGWSAGSVYNYVDFERKVFVQNVARVDMGTLTWNYRSAQDLFSASAGMKDFGQWINPLYVYKGLYSYLTDKTCGYIYNHDLAVKDSSYNGDADAFASAMSGVYAYYELATPIETDISAYITDDNLISVESGGSLTFPNQHGDDYRIDVPSSVTFVVGEP